MWGFSSKISFKILLCRWGKLLCLQYTSPFSQVFFHPSVLPFFSNRNKAISFKFIIWYYTFLLILLLFLLLISKKLFTFVDWFCNLMTSHCFEQLLCDSFHFILFLLLFRQTIPFANYLNFSLPVWHLYFWFSFCLLLYWLEYPEQLPENLRKYCLLFRVTLSAEAPYLIWYQVLYSDTYSVQS